MKYLSLVLVCCALLLGASPGAAATARARVDPRVLEDTAAGAVGDFLVVLKPQADTRALAGPGGDRAALGQRVYNGLRQTANASQAGVRAQLDALGVAYHPYWIVNLFAVKGDRTVVDALAGRADVLAVEPNRMFHVELEQPAVGPLLRASNGIEWNVALVNAPALWAQGYTGQGMVYANADTGVLWDHPALKSHYRGWDGATANHNYNWWDAIHENLSGNGADTCETGGFVALPASGSTTPCDDQGHGTHTMGIGIGDDGAGNEIGIAPGAQWMACRNMDNNVGRPSTYIECLQFLMAPTDLTGSNPDPTRHADAVGNSYVCPIGPPPGGEDCAVNSLQAAVENMRAAGIFMAVSAGNSGGYGCSSISEPPSFYEAAITVGATNSFDAIAGFSSRGPVTVDGSNRLKPDLVAPGVNVRSSYSGGPLYVTMSGTSMASPHVAGAAVLLWSAVPSLRGQVGWTEYVLERTAVSLPADVLCSDLQNQIPNNTYGYGRIDILQAYNRQAGLLGALKLLLPDIGK